MELRRKFKYIKAGKSRFEFGSELADEPDISNLGNKGARNKRRQISSCTALSAGTSFLAKSAKDWEAESILGDYIFIISLGISYQ